MNSRCQIDLIDMQAQPDGNYKLILVYQDHLTKFVNLRPLYGAVIIKVILELQLISLMKLHSKGLRMLLLVDVYRVVTIT